MAIDKFIPQIWSARMLANLDKNHVYAAPAVVNRDYEGEIKAMGDTVKINQIGAVTIGSYTKNTDIGAPEALTDAQTTLVIDQAKYFNFQVDDVDAAQQNPKVMDTAVNRAAYGLADVADSYIAGLYTGVDAANTIGNDTTPIAMPATTPAKAYEQLVALAQKLNEANVPAADRYVIVPAWFYAYLQLDSRFISAGTAQTDQVLANGVVGRAAGFAIYVSNNTPSTAGAKYKIIAGHPMAIAYAEQIVSVEAYRPEKRFSDAMKGLMVYGAKLILPKGIAVLTANPA